MTQTMGDKLARDLQAIKYIKFSIKTGRGIKIFVDEVLYAGLGKILDNKKQLRCCDIL